MYIYVSICIKINNKPCICLRVVKRDLLNFYYDYITAYNIQSIYPIKRLYYFSDYRTFYDQSKMCSVI